MTDALRGGVDCDLHPAVPGMGALFPYLDDHWRDAAVERGLQELNSIAYPLNSPLSARPDWRPAEGRPGSRLELMQDQALAPFATRIGILNCLYGVQILFSEDLGAAFSRALNDWLAREWLDRDERLRSSIVVPSQNPGLAAQEIERCATDRRFVQVLLLAMGDMPLGRRFYWPIYEAAERFGLPVGIHAGSSYRHPVTGVGWPSYYTEDYAGQAQAFQCQLTSLVCEGVFQKFPQLKVVLLESGVTWLPAHLWRLEKHWRALRSEIPWVDRPPSEIVRSHVRLTLQPFDGPTSVADVERVLDHLGSEDLILFSTDYPHWQFDGEDSIPAGLPESLVGRMLFENPAATYPRLKEALR